MCGVHMAHVHVHTAVGCIWQCVVRGSYIQYVDNKYRATCSSSSKQLAIMRLHRKPPQPCRERSAFVNMAIDPIKRFISATSYYLMPQQREMHVHVHTSDRYM